MLFLQMLDYYGSIIKSKEEINNELKPYIDLLKDMTTFHHKNRIKPNEAYQRYLKLIK